MINEVVVGGSSMRKTEDEAYNLIEEMALIKYQWSNKRGQHKRVGGTFDVNALTSLAVKMDYMNQRVDRLNINMVNGRAFSPTSDNCGSFDYVALSCQVGSPFAPSFSEQVAYINNFQPRPNHDPYSNA